MCKTWKEKSKLENLYYQISRFTIKPQYSIQYRIGINTNTVMEQNKESKTHTYIIIWILTKSLKQFTVGKTEFFQHTVMGQIDLKKYGKQLKLDFYLTAYTKIHLRWITDLNIKAKTIKLWKKTEYLCVFGINKFFLKRIQKSSKH